MAMPFISSDPHAWLRPYFAALVNRGGFGLLAPALQFQALVNAFSADHPSKVTDYQGWNDAAQRALLSWLAEVTAEPQHNARSSCGECPHHPTTPRRDRDAGDTPSHRRRMTRDNDCFRARSEMVSMIARASRIDPSSVWCPVAHLPRQVPSALARTRLRPLEMPADGSRVRHRAFVLE
jgi:hypothetical protein